eukprot:CAMPEP_0195115564 /NCGR_PEP_ID=MMETSP0448-20130528/109421_1 /TAXON_ID=66468 /ORGANISM="Heterocapsa triquestra, Strain CCMP 448" /LENGTH=55 /DNA_ID=CAMNT_0040152679 /DNA_START=80 /DNA_END=244 /DNA_ORIENTATION=-
MSKTCCCVDVCFFPPCRDSPYDNHTPACALFGCECGGGGDSDDEDEAAKGGYAPV